MTVETVFCDIVVGIIVNAVWNYIQSLHHKNG